MTTRMNHTGDLPTMFTEMISLAEQNGADVDTNTSDGKSYAVISNVAARRGSLQLWTDGNVVRVMHTTRWASRAVMIDPTDTEEIARIVNMFTLQGI